LIENCRALSPAIFAARPFSLIGGGETIRAGLDMKALLTTASTRDAIVCDGQLDPGIKALFKPFSYCGLPVTIRRAFAH
jgi:hypothetical protein